ncbi:zf-HC2 domain-containing protein [Kitasatospora sp. NPDC059463]|uniref:zf-HC2 domain-containing protein n=2 Tax=unclassified Kitasatospora TaxID=2633591 RepID=UPI0036AEC776
MTTPLSSPDAAAGAHPGADELADLAEDLLPPDEADALRRHLSGCAECRETADALAEVRLLLAGAGPAAMPTDVAARIDAALAAAAEDAPAPAPAPSPSVPSLSIPAPSPRPVPAPAAPPARPAAATGPGRAARPRRRRALLLGSAAALLAVGLGGVLLARPSAPERQGLGVAADAPANAPAAASAAPGTSQGSTGDGKADHGPGATVYREEQLAAQVRELLAGTAPTRPERPVGPSTGDGAAPSDGSGATAVPPAEGGQGLTGGRSAPACPPPSTAALLAGDLGSYAGAPAELLVYALPGRPDQLDVYLRSPGCAILLHRTVPAG